MNKIIEFIKKEIKVITFICTFLGTIAGGIKAYHDIFSQMETQGHSAKIEQKIIKLDDKMDNKIDALNNKIDALNNKFDKTCPSK